MAKNKRKHKNTTRNDKIKTTDTLAIFIVGRDQEVFLGECINECRKLTSSIVYLDLASTDRSIDIAKHKGVKVALKDQPLDQLCTSQWILFLAPDEKPALQSGFKLDHILNKDGSKEYSLLITNYIETDILESFQWLGMNDQYRGIGDSAEISTIEVRLIHRDYFTPFVKFMISRSKDDIVSSSSTLLPGIKILPCRKMTMDKDNKEALKDIDLEIKYLTGELSSSPIKDEGMPEFEDEFLIFSVLTKKDVGRYYKGLEMGFGSERMYLTLLHYLGQFGRFKEALAFFEAWKEKWGAFDTTNPLKVAGILYANLFEMAKAISCFEICMKSCQEGDLKEVRSLLGKAYLLQGRKEEALSCFKQAQELGYDRFNDIIVQAVDTNEWKPATLTVCMIAQNEESTIGKALESVSGIADEIIIVDTGSTDNTKEIISRFNAKVIDMPWEHDFSKARNVSLRGATCDYILCLDADEYIDPRERIKLALTKRILPVKRDIAFRITVEEENEDEETAVMLRLPDTSKPQYPVRLFPTHEAIRFEGMVFESVDTSLAKEAIATEPNELFKITHLNSERKSRNRRKEIAVRNTYDSLHDSGIALTGAMFYLNIDKPQEALLWLQKADLDNPVMVAHIISLYSMIGRSEDLGKIVDKTLRKFPDSLEMILAKAELSFMEDRYEMVSDILQSRMETITLTMESNNIAKACYLLGMALIEAGNKDEGVQYLVKAREEDMWNSRYKIGGVYALVICGESEAAIGAAADIIRDEHIDLSMSIADFADMGILFSQLSDHFMGENRAEAASLCAKMVDYIVENQMIHKADIEKMTNYLNLWNESRKVPANA